MPTTPKGAPYPAEDDSNNVPNDLQALAEYVDARPGVSPLTTAQRNTLAGQDLWDGRIIWNLTDDALEQYDAGAGAWASLEVIGTTVQVFNASGTWTKPDGAVRVDVYVVGGGAGGNWVSSTGVPDGGGGAAGYPASLDPAALGATETVTVGAGGMGQMSGVAATAGGTSSFGVHVVAPGGGSAGNTQIGGGIGGGGEAAGAVVGGGGGGGVPVSLQVAGGDSVWGGGGGGCGGSSGATPGGKSANGGNGGTGSATSGSPGQVPGGGGGGGRGAGNSGGPGGAGRVVVITHF